MCEGGREGGRGEDPSGLDAVRGVAGVFWARWVVLSVALTLPFLNQI